jgi:hypothetical protein
MDAKTWMQYEEHFVTFGIAGLILYMMFIIYRLAKDSNAGKFGYFILFFALGLGMVGFIAKIVIVEFFMKK